MGKHTNRWLFLLPNLLGVTVFALVPMGEVLVGAFRSAVGKRWVGLENFHTVLGNRAFRLAAGNTGRFMLVYPAAADAFCAVGPGASLAVAL